MLVYGNLKNNMDHTETLLILNIAMFLKYDIFNKLIWKNSTFLLCLILEKHCECFLMAYCIPLVVSLKLHRISFNYSVADGIKYFKMGKQPEAIQYLNKALQIDETNVEALTARGALYGCWTIKYVLKAYLPLSAHNQRQFLICWYSWFILNTLHTWSLWYNF